MLQDLNWEHCATNPSMGFPFPFPFWTSHFSLENTTPCSGTVRSCPAFSPCPFGCPFLSSSVSEGIWGVFPHPLPAQVLGFSVGWEKLFPLPHTDLTSPSGVQAVPLPPQRALLLEMGGNRDQNGIFMVDPGWQTWLPPRGCPCPSNPNQTPPAPLPGLSSIRGLFLGRIKQGTEPGRRTPQTCRSPVGGTATRRRGRCEHHPGHVRGDRALSWGAAREELKGRRADPPPSCRCSLLGCCCDRGWGRGWPPFAARRGGKRGCECV